tara:strand:- start:525 stop:2363 length:1839 start_codon:yes stop_codon:yes gene_type:complete
MEDLKRDEMLTAAHYSKHDSTLEVREENGEMIIEGYAALYNNETDLGAFRESISPGAFDDVLADDVRALINHDPSLIIGRSSAGTLQLSTDEHGLKYVVKLGEQQYAKDLYTSIKRGDITQSSFAFTIQDQTWSEDRSTRKVEKVGKLLDISPVTYPAYKSASVAARNEEQPKEIVTAETKSSEKDICVTKKRLKRKKMDLNEMKTLRSKNYEEHVSLMENAESEGRELTNEEEARADYLESENERLDNKLKRRKAHEDMIARQAHFAGSSYSETKEMDKINRSFSLSRAVEAVSHGRGLEGAEAEWAQEARSEMQARGLQMTGQIGIPEAALYRTGTADNFQAGGTGMGSGYVPTEVGGVIEALRAPTLTEQLGATTINGATGNLKFPRVSKKAIGTQAGEVVGATGSGLELDDLDLTPKRVASFSKFSKQLILQGGQAVDQMIARELVAGVNDTIDKAAFVAALGTPEANTAAVTAADFFEMESAVLAAGGNLASCKWAMSPSAWSASRSLAAVASVDAFWDQQRFDGFTAMGTPNLLDSLATEGQVIFGDWQKGLVLAFFGGIDLLVDPYTAAGTAQVSLHLNKFYDVGVRQSGAFSSKSAITNGTPTP